MKKYTVNAFIKDGKGGNPAGVVLEADNLSPQEKQSIATAMGHSETAFISGNEQTGFILDYFTPNRQIPLCGHATVGAFGLMKQSGLLQNDVLNIKTMIGDLRVFIKGEEVYLEQPAPTYAVVQKLEPVLQSLGITTEQVIQKPVIADIGNRYLVLEVPSEKVLAQIIPNLAAIELISEEEDLIGYYIYTRQTNNADATARMFAPRYQIPEESATGVGAGLLSCYLFDHALVTSEQLTIHQGFFMPIPSPSEIHTILQMENGMTKMVQVGGYSKAIN